MRKPEYKAFTFRRAREFAPGYSAEKGIAHGLPKALNVSPRAGTMRPTVCDDEEKSAFIDSLLAERKG